MSEMNCPYCEIKEQAKIKTLFEAVKPIDEKCPDCGAYIDAGQHSVRVNGYADIYRGCVNIVSGVVDEFNHILKELDIDLKEEFGLDYEYELEIPTTEIIEKLFLPYYGGTTKSNFANAIGIKHQEQTWTISKEEAEEE